MKFYQIQYRETGNVIENNLSFEQAEALVKRYEEIDIANYFNTPDFYEIKEMETEEN
jgi:Tfp pilus assembly protein PilX